MQPIFNRPTFGRHPRVAPTPRYLIPRYLIPQYLIPQHRHPAGTAILFALCVCAVAGCGLSDRDDDVVVMDDPTGRNDLEPDDLGPPPAFNPGGTSDVAASNWTPSGNNAPAPVVREVKIDVDALRSQSPVDGGQLNLFFPPQSGDVDRVAKQEKDGFAQYSYRRDGEEFAQLSITDLRSNPSAATKFQTPEFDVDGYPAVSDGSKGTTMLVGGRFQVKVRSPAGQLDASARKDWLSKFDLESLESFAE